MAAVMKTLTDYNVIRNQTGTHHSESYYKDLYDKSIRLFFWNAFRVSVRNPNQALFFFHAMQHQINAAKTRSDYAKKGINVPPIMIISVTDRCNLHCKGCYNRSLRQEQQTELDAAKLRQILAEANDLGVSLAVIAGGEPFIRPEVLDIAADFPKMQFAIFTNGLLINDAIIEKLQRHCNIVPVISLEGNERETDDRRGSGTFENLQLIIAKMKKASIYWGTSLTVTRDNFHTVTEDRFISDLTDLGCQLFFFIEYTPVSAGTEGLVITDLQRDDLKVKIAEFREQHSALFASIPGDEEEFGGCLAGGRGFIHVSAKGDVEPCPFVPYSDSSLKNMSLKEALQSDFLKNIRENTYLLEETSGGCALWNKKEWLETYSRQRS